MADALSSAAAPILSAALADAFSPDSSSLTSPLNQRLEDLGIAAEELRCLVSICCEHCDTAHPWSDIARRLTVALLYLAEKMADRIADVFSSGELDRLSTAAVAAASNEGGAA